MKRIEEGALRRLKLAEEQQVRSVTAVLEGQPHKAEEDLDRAAARLQVESTRVGVPTLLGERMTPPDTGGPERIWGNTVDFVGVAFLQKGAQAARAVGRVAWRDRSAQGSGFLIAPGLFLTNNHVLGTPSQTADLVVEFNYELDPSGSARETTRFEFAPNEFFVTDDTNDLDYTVIAVGPPIDGPASLADFGYCPLSAAGNKHSLGEVANIVQHPDGRYKEVVLRENRLVSRLSHVLHYVADTEPGSSGSPVFNNDWQAIALHHWGGPWRQRVGPDNRPVPRFVNEGIRISAIVNELRDRMAQLPPEMQGRLARALRQGEQVRGMPQPHIAGEAGSAPRVEVRPDGSAVWRVPIEISVGLPSALAAAPTDAPVTPQVAHPPQAPAAERFRRTVDRNYNNRRGYKETFLRGHPIPMPEVADAVRARLARSLDPESDDPFEFPYNHFSIYVDGTRGLPLVTACNINGRDLKNINRETGAVTKAESLAADALPEGREKWYLDPRIAEDECGNDELYLNQRVSAGRNRTGRIFHRGHMVRRLDPCWGTDRSALRAEADTFHFTNCTPQVGKFNSGRTLWQGLENHVLDNARDENLRVTVFTGTVLSDDDPLYRTHVFPGFRVPMQFWKIAIWAEDGRLSALAMIADQTESLTELPEGAEGIDDDEGVRDFITVVPHIEQLTGLDFGDNVREADLYELIDGSESARGRRRKRREITDFDDLGLASALKRRGKRKR